MNYSYVSDTPVVEIKFSWGDVECCLEDINEEVYKQYEALPDTDKQQIASNFSRVIGKYMEDGLMSDWAYIMRIALDEAKLVSYIREEYLEEPKELYISKPDHWQEDN